MRVPLLPFLRLIPGVARDHLSPPALLARDCDLWMPLSLFQAYCPGIFWPRACSLCFAGWNSFPGTRRQLGVELGIESMLLESQWNALPAVASFPPLEDLPEQQRSAEAVVETWVPQVGFIHLFLVILRRAPFGGDVCPQLPELHRTDPLYFEVNLKPNCALRIFIFVYQYILELG